LISGQRYFWALYDDTVAYMLAMKVQEMRTVRLLDQRVPAFLRPLIRAYLFGYASSTVPRLLTLFLTHLSNRRKSSEEGKAFWPSLRHTLYVGLDWQQFPTFCATLAAGSSLLQARDHFQGQDLCTNFYSSFLYASYLRIFPLVFRLLRRKGEFFSH
jgi:hypothetical protein